MFVLLGFIGLGWGRILYSRSIYVAILFNPSDTIIKYYRALTYNHKEV